MRRALAVRYHRLVRRALRTVLKSGGVGGSVGGGGGAVADGSTLPHAATRTLRPMRDE